MNTQNNNDSLERQAMSKDTTAEVFFEETSVLCTSRELDKEIGDLESEIRKAIGKRKDELEVRQAKALIAKMRQLGLNLIADDAEKVLEEELVDRLEEVN
jgi:hypothetical protein